jgi:hypothetical protein
MARPKAANFPYVSEPRFYLVCAASALIGVPAEWVTEMLADGEIALFPDGDGFGAINELAHALSLISVPVIRGEDTIERQQQTTMAYAHRFPLVWIDHEFGEKVTTWARDRGPMTLLVQTTGPLAQKERRRIERFVVSLERQAE